ncbi:MAG: DUF512 domain-containing protein, partial [bacterium]
QSCHCRCCFCFIDQLPRGLRNSLYVKDEDYRFSFLYGNYVTLVGLKRRELDRIIDQRLSPLYVSIHATDSYIRGALLGLKSAPILPRLRKMISAGIQIHGQIVLVPGWNDGKILKKTLSDLQEFYPGLNSLSVVPVGLTAHRSSLPNLHPVCENDALAALGLIQIWQRKMLEAFGSRWVYPADELLFLAGESIPPAEEYEDFPQIENGVGILRSTLQNAQDAIIHLPSQIEPHRRLIWVTGLSAFPVLKALALKFTKVVRGLEIEVLSAENHLFGRSITVAGLLSGGDIAAALDGFFQQHANADITAVFLPPDCLNADGLFLDDWTVERLKGHFSLPVAVFDGNWEQMILGKKNKERRIKKKEIANHIYSTIMSFRGEGNGGKP